MAPLTDFYPETQLQMLAADLGQQELPLHFVPLFGGTLARAGFALPDVRMAYMHLALRDQLSDAIRLAYLGRCWK